MVAKKCFKCGEIKELTEFYVHKQMADGHLNKCKACTQKDTKTRTDELLKDEAWHEKEKERHREKYYRLGYKHKHKPTPEEKREIMKRYNQKYPEKQSARNKSQHLKKQGFHNHHWSYKEENAKDIFCLNFRDHAFVHRHLNYDSVLFCYVTKDGVVLDTREKHEKFINEVLKTAPF